MTDDMLEKAKARLATVNNRISELELYSRFTAEQLIQLMEPLSENRVSKRSQGGTQLSYVEAHDIKNMLIRIFGFGGFSSDVISSDVKTGEWFVNERSGKDNVKVLAVATVRITLHAPSRRTETFFEPVTYTETAVSSQTGADEGDTADFAMKGLALDTVIPTPDGWTTMGELRVGDTVFDMHGNPTVVLMKSEIKHLDCYRITFSDGQQIICDEEHLWYAKVGDQKMVKVHSVIDMFAAKEAGQRVTIPMNGVLATEDVELPIDPWTLGYWLGNGDRNSGRVTANADDVDELVDLFATETSVYPDARSNAATIRVGSSRVASRTGLTAKLRHAGILGQKMIPTEYMRASAEQRLALLRGLMDSDGTVGAGRPIFSTTSALLAQGVVELVRSLGDRPSLSTHNAHGFGKDVIAYTVTWTPSMVPFNLVRKANKVALRKKRGVNRVRSIEKIDTVPTQCIGVESESKSFLAGKGMVPTHNTAESDAFKRAAIFLGTQMGLSLYAKGSMQDQVRVVFEPTQAELIALGRERGRIHAFLAQQAQQATGATQTSGAAPSATPPAGAAESGTSALAGGFAHPEGRA